MSSYYCIFAMVAETLSHALTMLGQDSVLWQLCECLHVPLCMRMWYLCGTNKGDYTGDLSQFNILNFIQMHVDNFFFLLVWGFFVVFVHGNQKTYCVWPRSHGFLCITGRPAKLLQSAPSSGKTEVHFNSIQVHWQGRRNSGLISRLMPCAHSKHRGCVGPII